MSDAGAARSARRECSRSETGAASATRRGQSIGGWRRCRTCSRFVRCATRLLPARFRAAARQCSSRAATATCSTTARRSSVSARTRGRAYRAFLVRLLPQCLVAPDCVPMFPTGRSALHEIAADGAVVVVIDLDDDAAALGKLRMGTRLRSILPPMTARLPSVLRQVTSPLRSSLLGSSRCTKKRPLASSPDGPLSALTCIVMSVGPSGPIPLEVTCADRKVLLLSLCARRAARVRSRRRRRQLGLDRAARALRAHARCAS